MPIPGILSVHNVTASYGFYNAVPTFTTTVNSLTSSMADEVIIKSITWIGNSADANLYLVWCSLNNDIIGSFAGSGNTSTSPGTRICLNGIVPNQLTFRLMYPVQVADTAPQISPPISGDIAIHMEFITYQR